MTSTTRQYSPGSLVRARDRDWVVIPSDDPSVALLRPIDGMDEEAVGILLDLERDALSPSEYPPPDPALAGEFVGATIVR